MKKNLSTINKFVIIPSDIIRNENLSDKALKLYCLLIDSSENFKPTYEKLTTKLKCNKSTTIKAIQELKELGYLEIKQNGRASEWIVYQEPNEQIKAINFNNVLEAAKHGQINPEQIQTLINFNKISKYQAQDLYKALSEFMQKINLWINQ